MIKEGTEKGTAMEKVILHAKIREERGKSKVKKLRKENMVPTVCYKDGKKPINLKVNARDLFKALHTKAGENVLITLKIEPSASSGPSRAKLRGGDPESAGEKTVIIKEIQTDPIKEDIIHIDFKEISLTEEVRIKVPVAVHGEAQEVVKEGGIVEHAIWEVDVECLPTKIPEKIEVEVSGMKIGDTIYIKDLKVPEGVKILNDPELVVLIGKPPAKEEIKVEEAAEEITEPEVIEKGKKEVVEEEAEEKAPPPKKEEKKG